MKKILIGVSLLVVAVIAVTGVVFIFFQNTDEVSEIPPTEENLTEESADYRAYPDMTVVPRVEYPDPLTLTTEKPDDLGNLLLISNKNFTVEYFTNDQLFNIVLYGENLLESRVQAQNELMKKLSLGEEDMCKIKTYVGVIESVRSELAGQNLGLSFCPESVDLSLYTVSSDGTANSQE